MQTTIYQCTICQAQVPFSQVRYSLGGSKLVCVGCHSKLRLSVSPPSSSEGLLPQRKQAKTSEGRKELQCASCRYKFSLKKHTKIAIRCPYCSGQNLMMTDKRIGEILEESL